MTKYVLHAKKKLTERSAKWRFGKQFAIVTASCLFAMTALAIHQSSAHGSRNGRYRGTRSPSISTRSSSGNTKTPAPAPAPSPITPPATVPAPAPAPVPAPSPSTSQGDHEFGFSAGDLVSLSPSQLDARLADFQNIGAEWVRFDMPWSVVQEGGSNSYRWDIYDKVFEALAKRPMKVLVVLDYTPSWARSGGCGEQACAPANPAQFASFASTAVNRYKLRGVSYWEIWNEPNHEPFWQPAPSVSQYANLLKQTYPAIKQADPSAVVLTGGLSPAFSSGVEIGPKDFIAGLYAQGAKGYFDAVAHHPYSFPALPGLQENWNGWQQMLEIRSVMVANGDSAKKVWMTEYGAPTGGPGPLATLSNFNFQSIPDHVDEALQARLAQDAIALHRGYDWAGPLFWHRYQDTGSSQSTNENFFGLVRTDGSKKPAYDTLYRALR